MHTERNQIFAVIDPSRTDQWALRKALRIAKNHAGTEITAYLCHHSDAKAEDSDQLREVEMRRHSMWLDEVIGSYAGEGVAISPVIEWNADWREAICEAAELADPNLVIKRASGRPKSLANSDRHLIRHLRSALLLVKHDPEEDIEKVAVAVDFNTDDDDHVALNEAVMALGKRIRGESESIELHCISAYPRSDKFVHPPDVAKTLDIDRSQAHVREGSAASVIPEVANEIDADLVVIGNVGRRGVPGVALGNTAEKILTDLHADVVVLVQELEEERSAA